MPWKRQTATEFLTALLQLVGIVSAGVERFRSGRWTVGQLPTRELRSGHTARLLCIVLYVSSVRRIINIVRFRTQCTLGSLRPTNRLAAVEGEWVLKDWTTRKKTHETAA